MPLHVRLIPTLTLKDGRIIKTVGFDRYRDVGDPVTMGKVFESQDVDELAFLDIAASQERREPHYDLVHAFAEETTMPLAVGGGVASVAHMDRLLRLGADKIVINSGAIRRPELIADGAKAFGSQCIVVSIDAARRATGGFEVLIDGGGEPTGFDPVAWARRAESLGAGEILLTSIDRDGTMEGYDLELTRAVSDAVTIPVIASGGCGLLIDLVEAVTIAGASAVACSSLFHFTDNKPIKARSFMLSQGVDVRPI
jgi:imidazole glycerol-phosphate synthase subunit HisF